MSESNQTLVVLVCSFNDELHLSNPSFAAGSNGLGPAEPFVHEGESGLIEGELEVDQDLAQVGVSLVLEPDHSLLLAEFLQETVDLSHGAELLFAPDQVVDLELIPFTI